MKEPPPKVKQAVRAAVMDFFRRSNETHRKRTEPPEKKPENPTNSPTSSATPISKPKTKPKNIRPTRRKRLAWIMVDDAPWQESSCWGSLTGVSKQTIWSILGESNRSTDKSTYEYLFKKGRKIVRFYDYKGDDAHVGAADFRTAYDFMQWFMGEYGVGSPADRCGYELTPARIRQSQRDSDRIQEIRASKRKGGRGK